jgi:hypothetical protein
MTLFHEFLVPEFRDASTFDAVRICLDIDRITMFQEMIPEIRDGYVKSMLDSHRTTFTRDVYDTIYKALRDTVLVVLDDGSKLCILISYEDLKDQLRKARMLVSEVLEENEQ